jgi:hypothetical protein
MNCLEFIIKKFIFIETEEFDEYIKIDVPRKEEVIVIQPTTYKIIR